MHKEAFPILTKPIDNKRLIYLDSACTYLKNTHTIDGILSYYHNFSCCSGDRESSLLGSSLQDEISQTRKLVSSFIGAKQEDYIIFTGGTTDGINKLLFSLDEKKIRTIITSDLEHNSNYLPQLEYSKQKNIDFKVLGYQEILDIPTLERTLSGISGEFLFCFTHSSNIIGGNFNIKEISSIVHKYGGYLLVDDAQYISYNREDVTENGIDFLAFSAHKLGGPTGIGVLYIKDSCESIIKYSAKAGGGTVKSVSQAEIIYKKLPYFLEGGVQDFAGILGLKSCIQYIETLGVDTIHTCIIELTRYFWEEFNKKNLEQYFDVISLKDSSIISLIPRKFNAIDFHQYCNYFLDEYVISFRTGTMCADNYTNVYLHGENNIMRLSFGIYNTKDDIDIFIRSLIAYMEVSLIK